MKFLIGVSFIGVAIGLYIWANSEDNLSSRGVADLPAP